MSRSTALANKGLLRVVLDLGNGQTAVVYNTHLQAKEGPEYIAIRQNQMLQIRRWMESDLQDDPREHMGTFLLGDFNVSHRVDTGSKSSEYDQAMITLDENFIDPFYKDHNIYDESRTKNEPHFLPKGLSEPRGSWYEGANPGPGKPRGSWGQDFWHKNRKSLDGCILDHQFIYDPERADRFTTHSEIRHLGKGQIPSGPSDHLPLSVIYKEKPS